MSRDVWLAIAHHLAVFGLLAVLAAEWGIVRPGLGPPDVRRLRRFDAANGALAGVVLAARVARLARGSNPAAFYLENPVFWLKLGTFATVGLLSIVPSVRYRRWWTRLTSDPAVTPTDGELRSTRRFVLAQLGLFPLIPASAAMMARGIGL